MRSASVAYLCWSIALAIWLAVKIADAAGIRINHTPSLPMGIWRIEPPQGPIRRGQIVSFCPPDTVLMREARDRGYITWGQCRGGYEPMLKPVIAIAGDRVAVAEQGLTVNGKLAADSRRLALDASGNASPAIPGSAYNTEPGQVWVLSAHHTRSFDSRYFGPVSMENILGLAEKRAWPGNALLAR